MKGEYIMATTELTKPDHLLVAKAQITDGIAEAIEGAKQSGIKKYIEKPALCFETITGQPYGDDPRDREMQLLNIVNWQKRIKGNTGLGYNHNIHIAALEAIEGERLLQKGTKNHVI